MDDLTLTRLIGDNFSIDSGGKTAPERRKESEGRKYFSRMVPQTLSFDGPPAADKENRPPPNDSLFHCPFDSHKRFAFDDGFESLHDDDDDDDEPFRSKYEIISTDSPDVRTATVVARDFQFGSPMDSFGDCETSETFDRPPVRRLPARSDTTRALDFDSPALRTPSFRVPPPGLFSFGSARKDSGLGDEPASPYGSPESGPRLRAKRLRRDADEGVPFDAEDSTSPDRPSRFEALISGEIQTRPDGTPRRPVAADRPPFRRCQSLQTPSDRAVGARAALFASPASVRKRAEASQQSPVVPKRPRNDEPEARRQPLQRTMSDNEASIKLALAANDSDLVGDFSRPFCLPLEVSQHQDLKAISGETLASLMDGAYKESVDSFQVIDCRYPYEFEGGHIAGAKNLYTEESVRGQLLSEEAVRRARADSASRNILVFHCEFSFERGPKMCRFLRRADRDLNKDSYPALVHPEMYVLRGGYRGFYGRHGRHCRPAAGSYTSMSDPRHASALKMHRSASSRKIL